MPVAGGQVHQAALGDGEEGLAAGQHIALDVVAGLILLHSQLLQTGHVHLHIKVAGVGEDGPVLHGLKVLRGNDAAAAGDSDEQVAQSGGGGHGHHLVAIHHRLQGTDRVRLGDDDLGAQALGPQRNALAAPAVAGDHHILAGHDQVGGAVDAVPHGLAGAVTVIEHVLAVGLVDHDHGEAKAPLPSHGAQPVDAGGGLLAAAQHIGDQLGIPGVHQVHQIAPVVDDDVGPGLQHPAEAFFIFFHGAAVAGKDLHPALGQGGGHIVLGGEGVGAGDIHLRPAHFQHTAEIGGLGLQMDGEGDL